MKDVLSRLCNHMYYKPLSLCMKADKFTLEKGLCYAIYWKLMSLFTSRLKPENGFLVVRTTCTVIFINDDISGERFRPTLVKLKTPLRPSSKLYYGKHNRSVSALPVRGVLLWCCGPVKVWDETENSTNLTRICMFTYRTLDHRSWWVGVLAFGYIS